jgi:tRNA nucleotidyltransferase (CCA-adding enzyme)
MEIALIISLIALAVALPGCIADSLTVIEKLRARRANRALFKKSYSRARAEQDDSFIQGSYAKMTRIRPINDVDILVACPSSYPNTSPQAFFKKI